MATPVGEEGYVGMAVQSDKGTAATAFFKILHTSFSWEPDVVQDDEPEPEIGAPGFDVALPERWGHQGATFSGEGRFRPGNAGFILRAFGMTATDGPFVIIPGGNDTIVVTDDGGGPVSVNILTGTGATAAALTPYTGTALAAHIEAALDGDTTLSETYTVTYATDTFTIAHAGATLTLHHTNAASNLSSYLGYSTTADDTGASTYDADNTTDYPDSHAFAPIDSAANLPWITIMDEFNSTGDLDSRLVDGRINNVTFTAEANNVVRFSYEGRALSFSDVAGGETNTDDAATLVTPNTANEEGYVRMDNVLYWLSGFELTLEWEEDTLPRLTQVGPEEITASNRRASGTADIYFGADDGDMFRKAYYGGASGTAFSTTIVQEALALSFAGGADVPVTEGADQLPYGVIFAIPECNIMTYPLEKSGGESVQAGMTFVASRGTTDYGIVLVNGYATDYYD